MLGTLAESVVVVLVELFMGTSFYFQELAVRLSRCQLKKKAKDAYLYPLKLAIGFQKKHRFLSFKISTKVRKMSCPVLA